MTRPLVVVDSSDVVAVTEGLRSALAGDGPAILPHPGVPEAVPGVVPRRVAAVVETSGSTGRPKRVALSADALLSNAVAVDLQLGGPGQWLLALPTHYVAGLTVLVRSIVSGTAPAVMTAGPFTPERFAEAAASLSSPRRFTSLVPTQLARLIAEDSILELLRRFDRFVIGGQSMSTTLVAQALELGLNVTASYGSSETCGGCVWDGVPIGDTEVRIAGGRVQLSGSALAEGYLDDPGRTALAFRVEGGKRWFRTDDTGEIVDGVLRLNGRVDDVIVSGGLKVSLAKVELAVRALPGLGDAVVVAAPHPEWGDTPVDVATNAPPLEQLRAAIVATLGPAAAPSRVLLVDAIPLLASGKPDRLAIAALALG
ncbi:MAG: AMP-binding protein [Solirubrobacteraceae bacterium]